MTIQTQSAQPFALDFAVEIIASVADFMPLGVFMTDQDATVLAANYSARAITAARDGIFLVGGRLATEVRADTEALHAAIARVSRVSAPNEPAVETLNVERPSGGQPLHLLIARLFLNIEGERGRRFVLVFLGHNETQACPDGKWLQSFFGLTRAEANLASLLSGGASLEEAARRLSIGIPTARTHLSRALDKTGATRQAELVRMILRGPALLNLPRPQ